MVNCGDPVVVVVVVVDLPALVVVVVVDLPLYRHWWW